LHRFAFTVSPLRRQPFEIRWRTGLTRDDGYVLDRPIGKNTDNATLEKRLWDAADQFRANSDLVSQQYSTPVVDTACGSGGMFVSSARLGRSLRPSRSTKMFA